MTIAVVYIYPQQHSQYNNMARRFSEKYVEHPPGESDHDLYVCVNGGGQITPRQARLFDPLVPKFICHNNVGKDIGAYQMAARTIPCDLLVCIGAPARPAKDGWLDFMVHAVANHGPGLYGCWGFHVPTPHIRTTVFWIPPQILNMYPIQVGNDQRYAFEHSHQSLTHWTVKKGFPALQVTARGVFPVEQWHHVEQRDCLFLDQFDKHFGWRDDSDGW